MDVVNKNPCDDRRKMRPRDWIKVLLGPVLTVVLFVVLYGVIGPRATAQEKLSDHETRIVVLEKGFEDIRAATKETKDIVTKIYNFLVGIK